MAVNQFFNERERHEVDRALEVLFDIAEEDTSREVVSDTEWVRTNASDKIEAASKILDFFAQDGRKTLK